MSNKVPDENKGAKLGRFALQATGGAIPLVGGFLSAIAGAWSEKEQERANNFFEHWLAMLEDELKEKSKTVVEIMARLDLLDQKIADRVESKEYQSLVRKTFRDWAGAESEEKRVFLRNILANAASVDIVSDDVIRLFIEWIDSYSDLHLKVISVIYNSNGITRREIWSRTGNNQVREDSAEADLFKLLIRDLNTGGVIRQFRQTDAYGNYLKKSNKSPKSNVMKSAFDNVDKYELTQLGQQFVHYAMTDLPLKITFQHEGYEPE